MVSHVFKSPVNMSVELVNAIRNHATGDTLMRNGKSVNTFTGYLVRHKDVSSLVIGSADLSGIRNFDPNNVAYLIREWTRDNWESLHMCESVGFWVDPETGDCYLDGSKLHGNKDHALSEARKLGELAIWDCAKGKAINVK